MMVKSSQKLSQGVLAFASMLALFGASAAANGANKDLVGNRSTIYVDNHAYDGLDLAVAANGSLSEIPVPGSLLIFGAGLVGLVVFSRHKIKKTDHL